MGIRLSEYTFISIPKGLVLWCSVLELMLIRLLRYQEVNTFDTGLLKSPYHHALPASQWLLCGIVTETLWRTTKLLLSGFMIFIGKYLFFRGQYLFKNKPPDENAPPNSFYRALYPKIIQDIEVRIDVFLDVCWVLGIISMFSLQVLLQETH